MTGKVKRVEDLVVGDRVDLESCPYLSSHNSAKFEYAEVAFVERETRDCVVIGYEGIDHIGYPVGTVLTVSGEASAESLSGQGADGDAVPERQRS